MNTRLIRTVCLTSLIACYPETGGSSERVTSAGLAELPIEQLMEIEVTSVSRKSQPLSETPAAVYVITEEEIRRSGMTTVPELLRVVPGLEVARVHANRWAITARGLNGPTAHELLVLVNGMTVYSPLFNGMLWNIQRVSLENIERIEVIRGPGGAVWGANAVNGVINIITKDANETQGGLVSGGGGNEERGFAFARYGGKIRENTAWRASSEFFNRGGTLDLTGADAGDNWYGTLNSFRLDWDASERDAAALIVNGYVDRAGTRISETSLTPPFSSIPGTKELHLATDILGRWSRRISDLSDMKVQGYYMRDQTWHSAALTGIQLDQADLDFQHRLPIGERNDFIWGVGYRLVWSRTDGAFTNVYVPADRTTHLFSGFLQDDLTLIPDRLHLIAGSKVEHNSFTEFEYEPTARLLWHPREGHTVWAAFSRAIRSPSIGENDAIINTDAFVDSTTGLVTVIEVSGNPAFNSEELFAYELGYRTQLRENLSFDLATFLHQYDRLLSFMVGTPTVSLDPSAHTVVPVTGSNGLNGRGYGAETSIKWQPLDRWKTAAGYTYLNFNTTSETGSAGDALLTALLNSQSPDHQFQLRSFVDLPWDLEFDQALYFVNTVSGANAPRYARVDARVGWQLLKNLELSVAGQNLFDARHAEFATSGIVENGTRIGRSVYGKLKWEI